MASMVSLNCDGDHATATTPGASVASPAGQRGHMAADEAQAAQEQELAEVSTPTSVTGRFGRCSR